MKEISEIKDILDYVPDFAWENLKNQTDDDLCPGRDPEFIKFICMSRRQFPSFVIFEEHIIVKIKETISEIKGIILDKLGISDKNDQLISIYFAGHELKDEDTLAEKGVAYPDKVYFYIDVEKINEWSRKEKIKECIDKLNKISEKLKKNPEIYSQYANFLRNNLMQNEKDLSSEIWKTILILRNFAGFIKLNVDDKRQKNVVLNSANHFLDILDKFKDSNSETKFPIEYNIVNILEWLAYRYPTICGEDLGAPIWQGYDEYKDLNCEKVTYGEHDIGKRLICNLLRIVKNEEAQPSLRLETTWALSWAGISHPGFATYIVISIKEILQKYKEIFEKDRKLDYLRKGIAVALLRSTVLRIIYPDAGRSEELGGFFALSTENALIVTEVAIKDIDQLNVFENIDLSSEFLYGFAILYSIAGDHTIASRYFALSASAVNDRFWKKYRLGLSHMESAENNCEDIRVARQKLDLAVKELKKAKEIEFNDQKQFLIDFRINLCEARKNFLQGINQWRFGEFDDSFNYFEKAESQYCGISSSVRNKISLSEDNLIYCYCIFSGILKDTISAYSGKIIYEPISFEKYSEALQISNKIFRSNFGNKIDEITILLKNLDNNIKNKTFIDELIKKIDSFAMVISICKLVEKPKVIIELLDNQNIKNNIIYTHKNEELRYWIVIEAFNEADKDLLLENYKGIRIKVEELKYSRLYTMDEILEKQKKQDPFLLKIDKNIEGGTLNLKAHCITNNPMCNFICGEKKINILIENEEASQQLNENKAMLDRLIR